MMLYEIETETAIIVCEIDFAFDESCGAFPESVSVIEATCAETGNTITSPLTDDEILDRAYDDDWLRDKAQEDMGYCYRGLGGNDPDARWARC